MSGKSGYFNQRSDSNKSQRHAESAPARKKDNLKDNSKSKTVRKTSVTVLIILFLLINAAALALNGIFGKINFVRQGQVVLSDDLDSIVLEEEPEDRDVVSGADIISDDEMAAIDSSVKTSRVDESGLRYEEGVKNILILGTDGRAASTTRARSDAIIIMSINENTKKIILSSIMRDTYVAIPGRTDNEKITHAHAYGGPELTVKTVEGAFGIKIDNYASVNFYSFIDIVDAFGGVDVDVTESVRTYMNNYIRDMNPRLGCAPEDGILLYSGENIHLSGKQALGYVRVRYTGGGDYMRTERQRVVFEKVIDKARQSNYLKLMNVLNIVASNLTTDYSENEILKLAMKASDYKDYEIVQFRIPIEDTYIGGMYHGRWVLRIDFEKNRQALYETVFGEE